MLFPRFSLRTKQDFFERLQPHLELLQGLTLHWTGDADSAERLMQQMLRRLPARLDELKACPAPRLWLVREFYREYQREQARTDGAARTKAAWLDRDSLITRFASGQRQGALRQGR